MGPAFVLLLWLTLGFIYSIGAFVYLALSRRYSLSPKNLIVFIGSGACGVLIAILVWGAIFFLIQQIPAGKTLTIVALLSLPVAALLSSFKSLRYFDSR